MDKSCKNSIILIDKPAGNTSFDIIKKIRKITGIKRVGHAGVLDRNASGLVVCATNRATKLLSMFEDGYKIYEAEILLGVKTDTYDITGNVIDKKENITLSEDVLKSVIGNFIGEIAQKPPIYSNVKINGKRLYKYALENKDVEIPKRKVFIYDIDIMEIRKNIVLLRIKCSKGTYIRTLANDLGDMLNTYGCIKSLRRTFSYPFDISSATNCDNIECLSVKKALEFLPTLRVEYSFAEKIVNGVDFCRIFNCRNIKCGVYRVFAGNFFVSIVEKKTNTKAVYRFILPKEDLG